MPHQVVDTQSDCRDVKYKFRSSLILNNESNSDQVVKSIWFWTTRINSTICWLLGNLWLMSSGHLGAERDWYLGSMAFGFMMLVTFLDFECNEDWIWERCYLKPSSQFSTNFWRDSLIPEILCFQYIHHFPTLSNLFAFLVGKFRGNTGLLKTRSAGWIFSTEIPNYYSTSDET